MAVKIAEPPTSFKLTMEITKEILDEHCRKHLCRDCPFLNECEIGGKAVKFMGEDD